MRMNLMRLWKALDRRRKRSFDLISQDGIYCALIRRASHFASRCGFNTDKSRKQS